MKVEMIEAFNVPPEIFFSALTDVKHHANWIEGLVELINLTHDPARLGTSWEYVTELLGRRLVTLNECNLYQTNQTFGWITRKPIMTQVVLALQPVKIATNLAWSFESESTGIAQLTEPLLVKETAERIQKSFRRLRIYLQSLV